MGGGWVGRWGVDGWKSNNDILFLNTQMSF